MEHITHFLASQHEGTVIIIIILVPDRKGHPTIFTHSKHSPTFTQKIFLSNSHSLENSLEASLVPEQKVQSAIHVPCSSGSLSSPNPPTWCHQSPPLSLFLLSKISLRQCVFLGLEPFPTKRCHNYDGPEWWKGSISFKSFVNPEHNEGVL